MNTKPVPAIIMLIAGLVACIVSFMQQLSFGSFVRTELLVLVLFYILGCIVRLILDRGFYVMQDPLEECEGMELEEDLIDEMAMSESEFMEDYQDR